MLILLLLLNAGHRANAVEHPNVLLVLSDDQSVPHLGCYGDPNVKTPRLDKFATQSIRFNRAYTTAPHCAPSRKSILTGRSAVALQQTLFTLPLQPDVMLFPEAMKSQSGYFIGLVGRDHHLNGIDNPLMNKIAERYHLRTTSDRFDVCQIVDDEQNNGNVVALAAMDQYKAFLNAVPAGKPFFLQLCFSDPHRPWDEDFHPYYHDPATLILPSQYPDTPELRKDLASYYDEVGRVDYYFGMVLDELKSRKLINNTIVIFMGDNGAALLRGKGTLCEYGLNVPLLIRWPNIVAPSVSSALVSGEDIAPTILDAVGIVPPVQMTGLSFLPLLKGDSSYKPRNYVYAERGAHVGLPMNSATFDLSRTIIGNRFKLIYNAIPSIPYTPMGFKDSEAWASIVDADPSSLSPLFKSLYLAKTRPLFEMYDLEKDPSEFVNLAENPDYLQKRYQLQKHLVEWMVLQRDFLPLPFPPE